jgi:hypothetical protein
MELMNAEIEKEKILEQSKYDVGQKRKADEQAEHDRLAEEEAKATERDALLARLGITADEAQLLLGGN